MSFATDAKKQDVNAIRMFALQQEFFVKNKIRKALKQAFGWFGFKGDRIILQWIARCVGREDKTGNDSAKEKA